MHAGREGTVDAWHARQTGAVHGWRAVPSLYPYGAIAEGRDLRLGRLRQRTCAQIRAGRAVPDVMGRIGHRARSVQPVAQHPLRPDGWVYVADRENHRIQVFDGNGRYET